MVAACRIKSGKCKMGRTCNDVCFGSGEVECNLEVLGDECHKAADHSLFTDQCQADKEPGPVGEQIPCLLRELCKTSISHNPLSTTT